MVMGFSVKQKPQTLVNDDQFPALAITRNSRDHTKVAQSHESRAIARVSPEREGGPGSVPHPVRRTRTHPFIRNGVLGDGRSAGEVGHAPRWRRDPTTLARYRKPPTQVPCGINRGLRAQRGSTTAYSTPISTADPLKNFHSRTIANVSRRQ